MTVRLLKSLVVGVVGALVATVLVMLLEFGSALLQMWWDSRSASAGIGAVSVAIPGPAAVIAAPVGFVIGAYWRFMRRT
jgi:hypothetical protein